MKQRSNKKTKEFAFTITIIGLALTLFGVVLSNWWGTVAAIGASLATGMLGIYFLEKRREEAGV